MVCKNCGKQLPVNNLFCPFCLSKIESSNNAEYSKIDNNKNNSKNEPQKIDPKYAKEFVGIKTQNIENVEKKVDDYIKKTESQNNVYMESEIEGNHTFYENEKMDYSNERKSNSFHPGIFFIFIFPIIVFVLFLVIGPVKGIYNHWKYKKEMSEKLIAFQYQESKDNYFAIWLIDPSLIINSTIENEILRIKKEVNNELIYNESDRLSVSWLDRFDGYERFSGVRDKKADCDDFAYLFWLKSQESEILKDKIYFATSDDDVFAHAFNMIWIGGEWRAIEPQDINIVFDLQYDGYVGVSKDAFNKFLERQQVMIFDVNNKNYSRAIVPLLYRK